MTSKATRRRAEDEGAWWLQPDEVFNEDRESVVREGSAASGWEAHSATLSTRRGASKRKSALSRPGKRRRGAAANDDDDMDAEAGPQAVAFEDVKLSRPRAVPRQQQKQPAHQGTDITLLHSLRPDKVMHVEPSHPLVQVMHGPRPSIGEGWPQRH